jgi:glycosyltransferase involved in cell wall biosynthesis
MKIQVFEQFEGGHHTNYIEALLPELANLVDKNIIEEVVITITHRHFTALQGSDVFKQFAALINFDPSLPLVSPNPSLNDRQQITTHLLQAIAHHRPDYLISTSADYESLFLAIRRRFGLSSLPKQLVSLGMFHYGYAGVVGSKRSDRFKQLIYGFAWKQAPWSRLLMVNPMIYEALSHESHRFRQRVGLLPDPVPSSVYSDKITARKMLNLPTEGRYVGFIGVMDTRKAIPELLRAWQAAQSDANDYLLLAGRLDPGYRQLIEAEFSELLQQGRIILLDQHLTVEQLIAGYSALDVVAVVQYRRANLSENLLKAIAAGRPAIVDRYGYTGMVVERFQAGYACDVTDAAALTATLKVALAESPSYTRSPQAERLIQFHHPSNFAHTVLQGLTGLLPADYSSEIKTWEWVCAVAEHDQQRSELG